MHRFEFTVRGNNGVEFLWAFYEFETYKEAAAWAAERKKIIESQGGSIVKIEYVETIERRVNFTNSKW